MTQFPIHHQQLQAALKVSRVNLRTMSRLVSTFDLNFLLALSLSWGTFIEAETHKTCIAALLQTGNIIIHNSLFFI